MASVSRPFYTSEQYLALERQAPYKHEYINGEIVAMSGLWEQREFNDPQSVIVLTSIACRLALLDIYDKVTIS